MTHLLRRALVVPLLLGLTLAGAAARAANPEVRDEAKFFTPAAVREANEIIQEIKQLQNKDVYVETFAAVPAADAAKVKNPGAERNRYFEAWAENRLKVHDVKGVYVLVCKSPGRVQVAVSPEVARKAFVVADRGELQKVLADHFGKNQHDQGLLAGLNFVRDRFAANDPVALPRPVPNQVRDYGHFFDPSFVKTANNALRDIHQQLKGNVTVETFRTVPPGKRREAETNKDRFFDAWIKERSAAAGVDGIFILICRNPARLETGVGPETEKKLFPAAERQKLNQLLVNRFRDKNYDQGLLDALQLIRGDLEKRQPFALPAAPARRVQDNAGIFQPGAVQQANSTIQQISRDFQKSVAVETVKTLGPDAERVNKMPAAARDKYYENLVQERMRQAGGDNIHVLICMNPRHLEIGVDGETAKKAFTPADRAELRKSLIAPLTANRDDEALLSAVNFIRDRLQKNLPRAAAATTPTPITVTPPKVADTKPPVTTTPQTAAGTKNDNPSAMKGAETPTKTGDASQRTIGQTASELKKQIVDLGEQKTPPVSFPYKYIAYAVAGLLGLFILILLIRGMSGGSKKAPPAGQPVQTQPGYSTMNPVHPAGGYQAGPAGGYPAGGTAAPRPGGGYQSPPARPVPPTPPVAPGGYQAGPPVYQGGPPQGGGSGAMGGFVAGAVGGAVGAVGGNMIYDAIKGRHVPGGTAVPPGAPPQTPRQPPAGYNPTGISTSGADFGDSGSNQISTSGADFGDATADSGSSGGDFGSGDSGSSGGDFGTTAADAGSSGGDFGSDAASSGGDFGSDAGASGGDFGQSAAADAGGGDFGNDAGGGDFGNAADQGGGDFGGGESADAGGDFGNESADAGGDTGGDDDVASADSNDTGGGDF